MIKSIIIILKLENIFSIVNIFNQNKANILDKLFQNIKSFIFI